MLQFVSAQRNRLLELLMGLQRFRVERRRKSKSCEVSRDVVASRDLAGAFNDWKAALDALATAETGGWTNPEFAPALLAEREAFRSLRQTMRAARQGTLPE